MFRPNASLIKRLRTETGWSLHKAGKEIGLHQDTIKRAESGELVEETTVKKLSDGYGVPVLLLIKEEGETTIVHEPLAPYDTDRVITLSRKIDLRLKDYPDEKQRICHILGMALELLADGDPVRRRDNMKYIGSIEGFGAPFYNHSKSRENIIISER